MINTKLLSHANLLINKNDYASAEKIYLEILAKTPNNDIVLSFLGRLYIKMKKYKAAERILEKAYNISKSAPTIASLAFCKFKINKYDEAVIFYEELFKYDPDSIKIYEKIIEAFRALQMYNFSHAYAQKMYIKHPDKENSLMRLTQSYIDIGEIKKAEDMCAKTIQTFPQSGAAWIIAGNLQEYCYCNEEMAQTCYKTAIDYGAPSGYYHLAVSYTKIGLFKEAEECYKKMSELLPDEKYTKAGLGMLYLTEKRMKEGYENFFYREKTKEVIGLKKPWDGSLQSDKVLLLYCDHGFGDIIQFIRYLPYTVNKFQNIIVKTRPELLDLLKITFPKENYPNIEFTENLDGIKYDFHVLSTDLPYYLDMDFDNIPFADGYLKYNENKRNYYKEKYFNTDKLKVGLCWRAGDFGLRSAVNRTINIDYFKEILGLKMVQFYSFQKDDIFDGCEKYPQIIDLSKDIESFEDTASAMENVDIMITADTACLHVAGALGKKTYLLIPYCSDWRWFTNENETEWYSSVEIFKQKDRQDWFIEADKICEKLKELIS